MKAQKKITIADDHALFRQGLIQLIDEIPELKIEGEATDGKSLFTEFEKSEPDILILDYDLPDMTGIEILTKLREAGCSCKVLLMTGVATDSLVNEFLNMQVDAIVLKSDSLQEVKKAIRALILGKPYYAPSIENYVTRHSAFAKLTSRERQVMRMVALGKSNKEIARVLGISHKTVDVHRTNLMRKLDLHNTAELSRVAHESGLI